MTDFTCRHRPCLPSALKSGMAALVVIFIIFITGGPAHAGTDETQGSSGRIQRGSNHALDIEMMQDLPGAKPAGNAPLDWATDGIVGGSLLLLLLGILTMVQLRKSPRWVTYAFLGIFAYGAILRWLLPAEASFTAWPYKRAVPFALSIYEGPVLSFLSRWLDLTIHLDDVIFATNRWIAILSPAALFVHARKLLRDDRSALIAAAIFVVYPAHLRHSASDAYFIQSLLMSSLAFAALYTALEEPRRWWGVLSFLAFPFLAVACYESRPLNIIFAPLFLGAILFTIKGHAVSWRIAVVAGLVVVATAAWSISNYLLRHFSDHVGHGLSLRTLWGFWSTFASGNNAMVHPWVMPTGVLLLMVLGGVHLWRSGGSLRLKCVFLLGWFFSFFITHGCIPANSVLIISRYLLHLAGPAILLAAAATPLLMRRSWKIVAVFCVYLALVPFLHGSYIGAVDFNQQREKRFLVSSREVIPEGCTVLEYASPSKNRFGGWFDGFGSRMLRTGSRIRSGDAGRAWTVSVYQSSGDDASLSLERVLSDLDEGQRACLYVYRGFECSVRKDAEPRMTPACQALEDRLELVPVASTRFPARVFDPTYSGWAALEDPEANEDGWFNNDGSTVELAIFRVTGGAEVP